MGVLLGLNVPLASAQTDNIAGLYKAILHHEDTNFFQYAKITLRTINPDGQLQISANVRVFFGEADSNEYITYEFSDVPLNLLTRQISIRNDVNDVSMIGYLRDGQISGEWFSTLVGYVGTFEAQKGDFPDPPDGAELVTSLSGYYRGTLENTNPQSNLPERVTFSFVTTQDNSDPDNPTIHISGNSRLYLGDFDSQEYVELNFSDIQFNFYNRFLTAKTERYGLTFKGTMNEDGTFLGVVHSDGLGEVANVDMAQYP
ncbi:MAG: hypothetical protein R3B45_07675 [Bdellovibrionota bacterium]